MAATTNPAGATQDAPGRDAPTQDAPGRDAPTQDVPGRDAPAPDAPTQAAPAPARREKPAPAAPFEFFDVHVVRATRLGPGMVRVTFGGDGLDRFASGGRDQRFKLFLPQPDQARREAPRVPTESGADWFTDWRAMDPDRRGIMRSYTVRAQRSEPAEVDVDFAMHGDGGPASRFASLAEPGDRAVLLGPVEEDNGGVDFRPPPGTDWILLAADATALPAVAGILEALPADLPARVWIEVGHQEDIQRLETAATAEIVWLVRDDRTGGGPGGDGLAAAVRDADDLPAGTPYAWIAGEASAVRSLRRHLVRERGIDRRAVTFTGYWRRGASEDRLLAEAVNGPAANGAAPAED